MVWLLNLSVITMYLTSTCLLIFRNWRVLLSFLALQYLAVMGLVAASWPLEIAAVKVIAGWMAVAVLMLTFLNRPDSDGSEDRISTPWRFFQGLAALLVGVVVFSLQATALRWFLSASWQQTMGGMLLIGLGLLQLGLTEDGLRTILGILTVLAGFEILYATLEASVLMTGMLAVLNIGVAFVGAYLLSASYLESGS